MFRTVQLRAAALAFFPILASATIPEYGDTELEARMNLLANGDAGYNLPPGSSFNSISVDVEDTGLVAFRVQLVPDADDPSQYRPGLWFGGHGVNGFARSILNFAGVRPVRQSLFGMVQQRSDATRARWLARMKALGRRGL